MSELDDGSVTRNPMVDISPTAGEGAAAPSGSIEAASTKAVAPEASAVELLGKQPMPVDASELHKFNKRSAAIHIETPMNLHQATAYTCLVDKDASMPKKISMLLASVLLVALQMRVLHAMVRGNWQNGASDCSSNYDCVGHPGGGSLGPKFCFFWHYHVDGKTAAGFTDDYTDTEWEEFVEAGGSQGIYRTRDFEGNLNPFDHNLMSEDTGRCVPCASHYIIATDKSRDDTIVYMDGVIDYDNHPHHLREDDTGQPIFGERPLVRLSDVACDYCTNYSGFNATDFSCDLNDFICQQCWDPTTRQFAKVEKKHVQGLEGHQYYTLLLTGIVIAANLISEIRDVMLAAITTRDGFDSSEKGIEQKMFAAILLLVNWVRRFAFCPGVLMIIPMVIAANGSDVMALCFNTVAVLFILQVDNQLYEFGLPTSMKRDFQSRGKVELNRADEHLLNLTQQVHLVGIPVIELLLMVKAEDDDLIVMFVVLSMLICGVVVALLQPAESFQERAVRAILAILYGVTGVVFCVRLLVFG